MIQVTRLELAGPTAREAEEQVAEYIEEQLAHHDGRILGVRTRRDGSGGLRVDFTYDAATPQVAMEITALVEPSVMALGAELLKLEAQLQQIVTSEHLGSWLLGIQVGANVRRLKQPLVTMLRSHRGRSGVAIFTAGESREDLTDSRLRLPTELSELGLVSAMRSEEGDALSIFPPISNVEDHDDGFGVLLSDAIGANVDKLREARPRETHLVVTLDRTDLSPDPARTPAPELPDGLDVLWVMLGYFNAKWTYRLWRTTAGNRRWHLLRHPLGTPPTVYPPL